MSKKNKFYPEFNDENLDRDKKGNEGLQGGRNIDDLAYNEEEDSSEIDVPTQEEFYDHPNPYKTSVKHGGDANSDYDEANKEALDQYTDEESESPYDEYEMRYADESVIEVDPADENLAETSEDQREDIDEEGYPVNDHHYNKKRPLK